MCFEVFVGCLDWDFGLIRFGFKEFPGSKTGWDSTKHDWVTRFGKRTERLQTQASSVQTYGFTQSKLRHENGWLLDWLGQESIQIRTMDKYQEINTQLIVKNQSNWIKESLQNTHACTYFYLSFYFLTKCKWLCKTGTWGFLSLDIFFGVLELWLTVSNTYGHDSFVDMSRNILYFAKILYKH